MKFAQPMWYKNDLIFSEIYRVISFEKYLSGLSR